MINLVIFTRYFLLKASEDKKSEVSESMSQSKGIFRGIASLFGK